MSLRLLTALAATVFACPQSLPALQISEILPENEGGLQDADLDSPGWIEIYNETGAPVNLAGWRLTDDAVVLNKWTFPSQNLAAGARLVVFASGKNRAVTGQELHANFELNPDGEYLALVAPDGVTIATEFNPFPKLRRNVSFANATSAPLTTPVLSEGASVKYHIPANDSLDGTWMAAGFDDAAWSNGTNGLGFDAAGTGTKIDIKTPTFAALPPPGGWTGFNFTSVLESGTGPATASVTVGPLTVKLDAVGTGLTLSARNRNGTANDSIANTAPLNNIVEDFIFSTTSNYVPGTPKGMNVTISGLTPNTAYPVTLYAYDRASVAPARVADWTDTTSGATGTLSFNGSDGQLADDAAFLSRSVTLAAQTNAGGQLLLQGRAAASGNTMSHNVFLNALQIGSATYTSFLGTNLSASLQGNTSSLYTRAAFNVAAPENYTTIRLRVRYDDGFFAWLNGTLIASRNAPGGAAWNAAATADRVKADGMMQEEISVSLPNGVLLAGTNVIAVQGLKQNGAEDTDFLLSPAVDLLGTSPAGGAWYATPTPGAANSTAFQGLVRDTVFSEDRKYFSGSITTAISCPTVGAQIRYSLDGSVPTAGTGAVYTAPLQFSTTTILRAAAFVPGWIPSNPDTQSYLNMANIAAQPAAPPGWPANWGFDGEVNGTVPSNYAMDQRVVTNTEPGYTITDALQALPTLSIAMNPADFLGSNGIYQNPRSTGAAWERDCSVELIDPAGAEEGFHETCRIEIHGNSSRRPFRMQKHAMRLSFKGEAGAAKLRYRFYPDSRVNAFDKLILRATFTDGWGLVSWDPARYRPDDSVMMRDVWMRRSWREIGNLSPHSRYVHLMINGLYWGVFDVAEHIDEDFVAAHSGGLPTDWEVVRDFVDPDASDNSAWKSMFNAASLGLSTPAAYAAIQQWLDPANFADYYLLHQFGECEDWPHHNGGAWRLKPSGKYKWLTWDQEIALDNHGIDRVSTGAGNTASPRTPGPLWQALKANAEFRLLVADRANFLMNNGGPLSVAVAQSRWMDIASQLDKPIVAESARWGDTAVETPYGNTESRPGVPLKDPYLRAADWLPNVNLVRNTWIPSLHTRANSYALITRLKAQNPPLWPNVEPPVFAEHGGIVAPDYSLTITAPAGTIYYTVNGSDPRVAVTGNSAGTAYSGPLVLTQTGVVKARAVTGTPGSGTEIWSALTEAQFIVGTPAGAASLAITEVCYNPPSAEAWEFIELQNISAGTIDLTDVQFSAGISYGFAPGTVLAAGQRLVLASDAPAFAARFPGITLHGVYTGKLDNSGEELALSDSLGSDIRRFTYNDKHPWPVAADGNGHSLTLIAPATNPDHALPENWRASGSAGGSPGSGDAVPFAGNPDADSNGNGYSDLFEYAMASPFAEISPGTFAVQFNLRAGADDAHVIIETSGTLAAWTPAATETLAVSAPAAGIFTVSWTSPPGGQRTFVRARVLPR
jgi:hypothetical protein